MTPSDYLALFAHFAVLSCLAIGGLTSVAPEIHRYVVDDRHLITSADFASAYTLGSIVPGPNMLFVTFVGWHVAGLTGALTVTLAVLLPSTVISIAAYRSAERWQTHPLVRALRAGLAPIAVALTLATGWLLARSTDTQWQPALLTLATIAVTLRTRINPLWLIAAGAGLGLAGWV